MKPRVVLANGVFDILHAGHVAHLEAARELGDVLWVSVTSDYKVGKGSGRPIFPQEMRIAVLKALRCVDHAIPVDGLIEAIDFVKPHVVVKGIDYSEGLNLHHEKYCKDRGIEIRFTDTPKISAADYLNESRRRQAV